MNTLKNIPTLRQLIKSHFLSGLLVIIPMAVIAWIVGRAANIAWGLQQMLPQTWNPSYYLDDPTLVSLLNFVITVVLLACVVVLISFLGWFSKQYFGQKALEFVAEVIQRIPVVRSIYSALDQLLRTMASGGGQQFSRVVYVEYPRKGTWAIAFVTGPVKGPNAPENHLNVYVPTTPNPTSGFHLLVPENEVRDSGMKVEEAFRTILSLGIVQMPSSHPGPSGPAGNTESRPRGER